MDGRTYNLAAHSQGGGRWRILVVGDPAVTGPCANGIAVPDPHKNQGLLGDCNVLLAARDALAGDSGLDWSADLPVAEWEGVTTGGSPARVRRVVLGWRGLTGNIPAQLGGLTRLEVLDLHDNELSGPIPLDLGNLAALDLAALDRLSFYGNQLSGSIPPELGNLVNLEGLLLNDNRLTGPIPPGLGDLANLRWLLLYDNQLSGPIPPELSNLRQIGLLHLKGNQLSGPIPPELGSLSNLSRIPHIGSLQAQWAIQTRWWHHIRVLQGQSIAGLSDKGCDSCREPCFLSVFVVFGPLPMG